MAHNIGAGERKGINRDHGYCLVVCLFLAQKPLVGQGFLIHEVSISHYVFIAVFTLDAGLLARSQYSEGPATGHLDTGFFLVSLCL